MQLWQQGLQISVITYIAVFSAGCQTLQLFDELQQHDPNSCYHLRNSDQCRVSIAQLTPGSMDVQSRFLEADAFYQMSPLSLRHHADHRLEYGCAVFREADAFFQYVAGSVVLEGRALALLAAGFGGYKAIFNILALR